MGESTEMKQTLIRGLALAVGLFSLVSCRTTVPEPTRVLGDSHRAIPVYSMHNNGPQRIGPSRAVRLTDINQDGHLDLLVGGWGTAAGFQVELGDGKGHWRFQEGPPTTMQPRAFAVADINGDGNNEIGIVGDGDQKGIQIWTYLADGSWKLYGAPAVSDQYRGICFADVNEDGWPDLIATRASSERDGGIFVWLNDGRGGWRADNGPIVNGYFTDVAVADVNGDGHADIVASRRGGLGAAKVGGDMVEVGGVEIWSGDGSGRWKRQVLPENGDVESLTVADVDGDGHLDIVTGLYRMGIHLWKGGASGWHRSIVTDAGTWLSVRVGDLDGDGKRELVAASGDGRGMGVWHWQGGKFASAAGLLPDYGEYADVDLGDVFGKGTLAVAAVRDNGGAEVWSGEMAPPTDVQVLRGEPLGEQLTLYFESATAQIGNDERDRLLAWMHALGKESGKLQFTVEGRADLRPIHSDLFPNNEALSRARSESVAALLRENGVDAADIEILALGAQHPLPPGMAPEALQQNRRVLVRAFRPAAVRLDAEVGTGGIHDLYHVDENAVFKTINGIPDYKVGPGDELSLTFWQGSKSVEHKVIVQIDGTVSLPYQEALKVSGLTSTEIDQHITELLSKYERHPRVDVMVLKHQSKSVTLFGEVQSLLRQPTGPGSYFLQGKETLVDFISRAGGPTKDADLTKVQIIRGGKTIILNLDRAIKQADITQNAILDEGDTIFIPSLAQSKRRVYVLGEVKKPGIVEFNGDLNFLDAVSQSGGFGDHPYYSDIRIIRADRDKPEILAISFDKLIEQGDLTQNLALQDKDIVIIPASPIANWNKVVQDIMPTINMLSQPINTYQQILLIRQIQRNLK